jgi:hypothetical protein
MNGSVYALAVSGSDLYVGGEFTTAGGIAANKIAKWDGNTWSALGSGMGGDDIHARVFALAASGSDLYAGGYFTMAGGNAARNIAKWDGSSWSALGAGMNENVYALAVSGSDLYAGGRFHDGGRQDGQIYRQMGRQHLVGAGFGDERECACAGGVWQRPVCGGRVHAGGRHRRQIHRQMGREQLVGAKHVGGSFLTAGRKGVRIHCPRLPARASNAVGASLQ